MTPREAFESIPVTTSGDLFIKAATPEQLAVILSDTVLRAEGLATIDAHMAEFEEEFTGENYIVPHLRIRGIWLVTFNLQAKADPDAPRIVAANKKDRTVIAFVAVVLLGVIALALGGKL